VIPIDTATDAVGTPILGGGSGASVAVAPNGKTVYALSNGFGLTPIDTATNTAGIGPSPCPDATALAITPDGKTAVVTCAGIGTASVVLVNLATLTVGNPISVGVGAEEVAISPNGSEAYVTSSAADEVTPIDLATGTAGTPITVSSPYGIVISPDQAPVAAFTATPSLSKHYATFDASTSAAPGAPIAKYHWNFGDGKMATTSKSAVTHSYANPGTYTVTLTLTDNDGTSTEIVYTGQSVIRNGKQTARVAHVVTVN
jgi:DNA-binding beta-propeller fold protein YncE